MTLASTCVPGVGATLRNSERVLVLVRGLRDAQVTRDLLLGAGFEAFPCSSVSELVARIDEGAGVALLEEEVLTPGGVLEALATHLRHQPPWSDLPVVVFGALGHVSGSDAHEVARFLPNATFLERPVRTRSMLASVHAALASRRRQYEARRAIESRDTFLAMLGHELRNPLGAIRLAIAMLEKKGAAGGGSKELAIVDRQASHLTRLVDDLLDVARVTQGKVTLERERLNLADVARSAFAAQEARAREHGLRYEWRGPEATLWVHGDRQRLEQVFANLITNAIKYTPRGGTVRVIVLAERDEGLVRVTDTGVGIHPDMIGRLFEAFAQAERTLDRTEGGIGLGLALVRSLVQLHGGTAEGSSEGPNRGSAFVVRLPLAKDVAPPPDPSSHDVVASAPGRRVLVVEDNDDIRELFLELLVQEGHRVSSAEDGPGGLEALLAQAPDIAFIDVGLPGFDGLELARRARAAGTRTKLVAVTGYGQAQDRVRAMQAGFDDQLTKPFEDTDLHRMMTRLEHAG
jgi:signal transduction histidine kinase